MTTFLIRRIGQSVVVLFLSSLLIFLILGLVPGGPLDELRALSTNPAERPTAADIARIEKLLGLDKPWHLRYVAWIAGDDWFGNVGLGQYAGERKGIIRGDWDRSWRVQANRPVMEIIGQRLPDTLRLTIPVAILSVLIAVPIGIFSAVRKYTLPDYVITAFSFVGQSLPTFWLGLMLISLTLTAQGAGWFHLPSGDIVALRDYTVPGIGRVDAGSTLDRMLHLVLPVSVLTLVSLAAYSRYMRTSMLEVLNSDYIRTARAKGLREQIVVMKHALRNALLPLITIVVATIPFLWGGAIITENVFNYKGMGWLFINALETNDWPVVTAFLLISSILVILSNLIADILYTVVDPRIRLA